MKTLQWLPAIAVLACVAPLARAQTEYPTQVIRIVVPGGAGGVNDVVARLMAPGLSKRLGRPVIVENRPGASTTLGGDMVARSKPDGHTLLMGVSTLAINPATLLKMPYDAIRDFAPITLAVSVPQLLVVSPTLKVNTVREFIAAARSRPDHIAYGSAGHGTNPHLAMELLASMTQIRLRHVPYNGGPPAVTALIGTEVLAMSNSISSVIQHVRSERLRALGVSTLKPTPAAPEVPPIADSVPGYEALQWAGLVLPAKTPRDIVARLHKESLSVLRTPDVTIPLANDGVIVVGSTPEEFGEFIRTETVKWAQVVKSAGVEPQ